MSSETIEIDKSLDNGSKHNEREIIAPGIYMPDTPGEESLFLVQFLHEEDPLSALNWPSQKVFLNFLAGSYTLATVTFGSSIYAPAIPFICEIFQVNYITSVCGISLYVFGFALGPTLWGPMSDFYGRRTVILMSVFGFTLFSFAVATAANIQTILICRFFTGAMGSASLAVIPASFSESINFKWRGISVSVFIAMVFCGPTIAPSVGAFICTSYLGWRWTHYILGIMGALDLAILYFVFNETFGEVILKEKAAMLRYQTGNWAIHSKLETVDTSFVNVAKTSLNRVFILITTEPIIILVGIYVSFVYAMLYLCLEAFPLIFIEKYQISYAVGELPYLAVTVGIILSSILFALLEMRYIRQVQQTGKLDPNKRLDNMLIPSIALPIGFFWFFWTAHYHEHIHWIVPTIGAVVIGFGLIGVFLAAVLYTVEMYLPIAASVMAANAFMRALLAGAFPLFAKQMFDNLGLQWGGTLLGIIAAVMIPIPILFRIYSVKLDKTKRTSF